ncbi:MAG TPA: hypothetical protein VMH27_18065 [Puia sp.]|nr:hypothetical protein [Puia sp.]
MHKMLVIICLMLLSSGSFAQVIGKVDRKTKEFSIAAGQKVSYMVFGYRVASAAAQKMICFASSEDVTRANQNLPLGAYFDTDRLPPGDRIAYLGVAGAFGKMSFITGTGKTVVFYLPRSSYVIK